MTHRILPLIALLLLLASCGSRRGTTSHSGAIGTLSKSEVIRAYSEQRDYPLGDVRGTLDLRMGGKSSLSSGYRMSLYPGEAMVISARPMGLFEAGRLTVHPDRIVVLDKMDRYGVDEAFSEEMKLPVGILDLFGSVSASQLEGMAMEAVRGGYRFTDRATGSELFIDQSLRLTDLSIDLPRRLGGVAITFGHFETLDGYRPLPRQMEIKLDMPRAGQPVSLVLGISEYGSEPSLKPDSALPDDYTRLRLSRLLALILGK